MKKIILASVVLAANFWFHGNAGAQVTHLTTLPGSEIIKVNTDVKATNQTVLTGNWTVSTDATGRVFVSDKENHVVRIYEGNEIKAMQSASTNGATAVTHPFLLTVDKEGRLHIVDKTALVNNKTNVRVLPHEKGNFSDPDMPIIANDENLVLNKED